MKLTSTMLRRLIKEEMSVDTGKFTFTIEGVLDSKDLVDELGPDEASRRFNKELLKTIPHLEGYYTDMLSELDLFEGRGAVISLKLKR